MARLLGNAGGWGQRRLPAMVSCRQGKAAQHRASLGAWTAAEHNAALAGMTSLCCMPRPASALAANAVQLDDEVAVPRSAATTSKATQRGGPHAWQC